MKCLNKQVGLLLAKHGGFDLDPAEFLEQYTRDVKRIADATSIRHLTLGDDEEHDLVVAIAMDTNPFEDGVRVPDTLVKQARELLPKQPTEDRILTLSESTNGSIVLHNINRRIQTNAKVLLLGDINMSNALYRQFETIIITIMKHLNITRDIKKH